MSHLVYIFFHYILILHFFLHDKVCLLNNFVFFNLIFGAAFMTGLFTCFINVVVCFISISEHFATIISPELCVLNLDRFVQPIFNWNFLITCQTHTDLYFFLRVLASIIYWPSSSSSMSHVYFKCFMSTCCSSTFIFRSLFTSMAF